MTGTTRMIPVTRWEEFHPWPTASALRAYVLRAARGEIEGFDDVVHRVGRRVLIDETAFFAWVRDQG